MKTLLVFLTLLCLMVGGSGNAEARPRGGYGPVTITDDVCYPSNTGFVSDSFDGDMSVYPFWSGSGSIAWTIEISGYTAAEDPSNDSFYAVSSFATAAGTNQPYTIVGPVQRFRFCASTCTGDCTLKVKVIGRVPN